MTIKRSIFLSVLLGIAGMACRAYVWNQAYDAGTKLIVQPANLLLFNGLFFCYGLAAALLYLLRWPKGGIGCAPYASRSRFQHLLRWGCVVCSGLSGGLMLYSVLDSGVLSTVPIMTAALLLVQAPVLILLLLRQDTDSLAYAGWLLLPTFVNCFLNVGLYHNVGAEPNPQVYLWTIVSSLLAAGAWVELTGFAYLKQPGRAFGLLGRLALMILPVGMAAPLSLAWRLAMLSSWLWLTASLLGLRIQLPEETAESQPDQKEEPEDVRIVEPGGDLPLWPGGGDFSDLSQPPAGDGPR